MEAIDWIDLLIDLITDESKHILYSGLLFAFGYLLTWIILYVLFSLLWPEWKKQSVVVFSIRICCLLVGCSLALAGHYYVDYAATWWETPLGPPLELH